MKKFIALTLSIVMLLSCMSLTVFAGGKVPLVDELGDYITDEVAALIKQQVEEERTKNMTAADLLAESIHVSSDLEFDGSVYTIKEGSAANIKIFSDFENAYKNTVLFEIETATGMNGIKYNNWVKFDTLNGANLLSIAGDAHSGLYPLTVIGTAYAQVEGENGKLVWISAPVELHIQIVVACNHVNKGETAITLLKASLFTEGSQVIVCKGCGATLRVETVPAVLLDYNGYGLFMAIIGILKLLFPTLFSPEVAPPAP